MSGLTAARELVAAGWEVTLLDKGRAVGGRMATREFDGGRFDYGAQFFTQRDAGFAALSAPWVASGMARPWTKHRFRVIGGIRRIAETLAGELDVRTGATVTSVQEGSNGWVVTTAEAGVFAAPNLLLTAPVPQSLALLSQGQVRLNEQDWALLEQAHYGKTLTLLACIEGKVDLRPDGYVEPAGGVLAFVADNFSKGVSTVPGCLTLHATREYSEANWGSSSSGIIEDMLAAAAARFDGRVRSYYLHRWKFAEPATRMPALFHGIADRRLAFAGDVFGGPRIGGAAASGMAAAAWFREVQRSGT